MNAPCRWRITGTFSLCFAAIGFALGWSIDTQHPDDRLADLLIPTLSLAVFGLLAGYLFSLVYYQRLGWFDFIAGIAIPPILISGYILVKSGDPTSGSLCGWAAVGIVAFLIFRFLSTSNLKDESQSRNHREYLD